MSRAMTATFPTYHASQRGDDEERQLGNSGSLTALPRFSPLRRSSTNSTLVNITSLKVPSPTRQDKRLSFSAQSTIERRVHAFKSFWSRFNGEGRKHIGVWESLKAIWASTWLNYLFVFVPATWAVAATQQDWYIVLPISFIAIIPLTKFLEYAGEQLALYCGVTLGDLIIVTCCNVVEVVLAIDLLRRCDLRLLQATIIGVTLLHLLLIPGSAFMTGGARVMELTLDKTRTNLNHTLLSIGVLTLLLPASFFAALDRGALPAAPGSSDSITTNPVTDAIRISMVTISRGLAIILLMVYVCSRIFLHNPPAPTALKKVEIDIEILMEEEELAEKEPEVNSWVCLILLLICVGVTASCTVFLLNSLEILRGFNGIQEEWFGLILLPFVSFSADAVLALVWYSHHVLKYWFGTPSPTESLASTKSIDASIQFVMFWMPFLVILGWITGKPMSLLFDLFEVALLLGAAFLVNYVTAGAKTNWGEGAALVAFYTMIAVTAFFYTGQPEIRDFLSCTSVAGAIVNGSTDSVLVNKAQEEFADQVVKHFKLHV